MSREYFTVIDKCPSCNSILIFNGEYLQCVNKQDCRAQIEGRILVWLDSLGIKEWGARLIDRLVDSGKVKTIADLYKLSINDLSGIERMGKKSAKTCYDILHTNKEISLEVFLGGLSIPMIGQSTIKAIMSNNVNSLEQFIKLASVPSSFESINGVGPIKAESLANGLLKNKQLIQDILDAGVTIKEKIIGKLTNKSVTFTGTMVNKRQVLEKMVIDAGGVVKNSVTKDLNFLVIADTNSQSSKAVAARKNGTTLISENEFLELIK